MTIQSLSAALADVPFQSPISRTNLDGKGNLRTLVTREYEGFFKQLASNTNTLLKRQNPSIFLNSNFNLLSANGVLPVTPAQGSDYELLKKWFVVNGGGINDYTLTPTAYTQINNAGQSASNYFLNVQVNDQDSPLYLYNLNYSQTGQFNSIAPINEQPLSFSWSIFNNTDDLAAMQFSLALSTGDEYLSQMVYLEPGYGANGQNSLSFQPIQLTGNPYSPSDFAQMRVYFSQISNKPINLNVEYLKTEFSELASPLIVNPVLESYLCANLL